MKLFRKHGRSTGNQDVSNAEKHQRQIPFRGNLQQGVAFLRRTLGGNSDFLVRPLQIASRNAVCIYIRTMTDPQIIESTLRSIHSHKFSSRGLVKITDYLLKHVIPVGDTHLASNLDEVKQAIVSGHCALLIDGEKEALLIQAQFCEHRTPEQPYIESTSRGSQIGFVENVDINIGLVRSFFKTGSIQVRKYKVGTRSESEVAVLYLDDVVNPVIIDTVSRRIQAVSIDILAQSNDLERFIVDNHWTPFPLVNLSQRVDSTIRELNHGKVAIIVGGDPSVIIVPGTLRDFYQTEEDYSHTFYDATFCRWLRIVAFLLAGYLPAFYVAFVDFNPELLPKVLGFQIARSREGQPFPAVIEVLLMMVVIEILREATMRMPKQMGQTIAIVGGLVVGEASVQAALVSNILIVVIALTTLSVFVTPSYEFSLVLRLLSWVMVLAATVMGLYGILLVSIFMYYHLASLKSFGVVYISPFGGGNLSDPVTDGFLRLPFRWRRRRPGYLRARDVMHAEKYQDPNRHPDITEHSRKMPNKEK
jgi:hypothetical protein